MTRSATTRSATPLPNLPQLQELEKETYRKWVDDGLADLFLGLSTLILGLVFFTDFHIPGTEIDLANFLFPLLYPLWRSAKHQIVEPRTGYFKLREPLRARMGRRLSSLVLLFAVLAVVLVTAVHFAGLESDSARATARLLAGFAFAIPVALASYWLALRRWVAYALVIAAAALLERLLGTPFGSGTLVAGALISAAGLAILGKFLEAHPPLLDELGDG